MANPPFKLIQPGAVDVIVSIGSNFFYTVTLPCTLWFFDRGKRHGERKDKVLFIDARPYFQQVTRAIREFTPEQLEFLANIVRLYRDEQPEFETDSKGMLKEKFPKSNYGKVLVAYDSRADLDLLDYAFDGLPVCVICPARSSSKPHSMVSSTTS